MLALDNNNELYRSHVEIKRRVVELCIQAVLSDMKDSNANPPEVMALAEDVMQWAYDLIGMLRPNFYLYSARNLEMSIRFSL